MLSSPIFRRYWLATSLLLTLLMCGFGAVEAVLSYRENVERLSQRQQLEARAAAREIRLSLSLMEEQLREVAQLPWESGALSEADRQQEFHRLQKLIPSIYQLRAVDRDGLERVFVSRSDPDRIRSGISMLNDAALVQAPNQAIFYGPVYIRSGGEPFVSLVVRERPNSLAATLAELDLRLVARLVGQLHVGAKGSAYIVDPSNRVIAHTEMSRTLLHRDLTGSPLIAELRQATELTDDGGAVSVSARDLDGHEVRATAVRLARPPWLLVVEEPLAEAMKPIQSGLIRTLGLLAVGLLTAFTLSLWLARQLTRPILQLRDGAVRIGDGDLSARVDSTESADELSVVAAEFNGMAERLEQSYAGLEAKVQARTIELAKASEKVHEQAREVQLLNQELTHRVSELAERRDEADRANTAKTRFLASASHDLRQPMHTISLLMGVLKECTGDRATQSIVAKIELSVAHMENLFGSLLDISKLDAGVVRPNQTDVSIDSILRQLDANFALQAHARGLRLRVVGSRAIVRSDPALLDRILCNLVANAIRYTARGGVLIGCRVRGAFLDILVIDTGIGIPAEHLSDIFEEFVQLDNAMTDRGKGLGLGLSIVQRTANILGHRLLVGSVVGRGSTFGIAVPFVGRRPRHLLAIAQQETHSTSLTGSFVAIVDDNEENLAAMARLCDQWGCLVVCAASSKDLIAELNNHLRSPDLIITDFRLHDGRTGLEAIAEARAAAELGIPAIIVTGDVAAIEASPLGGLNVVVLHKPLNSNQLRRAAEDLLGQDSRRTST